MISNPNDTGSSSEDFGPLDDSDASDWSVSDSDYVPFDSSDDDCFVRENSQDNKMFQSVAKKNSRQARCDNRIKFAAEIKQKDDAVRKLVAGEKDKAKAKQAQTYPSLQKHPLFKHSGASSSNGKP